MNQNPVGGIADRLLARSLDIGGNRHPLELTGVLPESAADKVRPCLRVVYGPRIVHCHGDMKEITGMYRRPGKIIANRIEQNLVPLSRDRMPGEHRGSNAQGPRKSECRKNGLSQHARPWMPRLD